MKKSNITKTCYHISPNHPETIARFEMMARDPSPSARINIAATINQIDKPWAKELWQIPTRWRGKSVSELHRNEINVCFVRNHLADCPN